jgi:hypothetical protein
LEEFFSIARNYAEGFDTIQARYGWADSEVNGLSFARFYELVELILKAKKEDVKERLIVAAFIGFQMGASGEKNFGEYLEGMGLKDIPQTMTAHDIAALERLASK